MKVVFRPCCNNCGYEFQELHGVTFQDGSCRNTVFEPSHCPKCHELIEGIVYFSEPNDVHIFDYSKLLTDRYTEGLKL
jgi:predicted Zn-ribbon and HTH transcriptional regulator